MKVVNCNTEEEAVEAFKKYRVGIIPILATSPTVTEETDNSIIEYFSSGPYDGIIKTFIQLNFTTSRKMPCTRNYLKGDLTKIHYPTVYMSNNGQLIDNKVANNQIEHYDILYDDAVKNKYKYDTMIFEGIEKRIRDKDPVLFDMKQAEALEETQRNNLRNWIDTQQGGQKRTLGVDDHIVDDDDISLTLELSLPGTNTSGTSGKKRAMDATSSQNPKQRSPGSPESPPQPPHRFI